MTENYIAYYFNLISIIIIIIMYCIVMKYCIQKDKNVEKFNMNEGKIRYTNPLKYRASNTRIMYNNTGELPWNRHIINSSIPYDINIKTEAQNVYYYEY